VAAGVPGGGRVTHIRIEIPANEDGMKRIVMHDRIIAVGDDGTQVDISSLVRSYSLDRAYGEPETIRIQLLGTDVERVTT